MNRETLYQVLLVILLVVIAIMGYFMMTAKENLGDVMTDLKEETVDYRAEIQEKCRNSNTADVAQNDECKDVLEEFAEILRDYQVRIDDASATTSTTTE